MSTVFGTIFSMSALWFVLVLLYVVVCAGLILVIMLQKGKGVGFAGAFGIGPGSEAIFGPRGSKSFPVRATQVGAAAFMLLAFLLSALAHHVGQAAAPEEVTEDSVEQALDELEELGMGSEAGGTAPAVEAPVTAAPAPEAGTEPAAAAPTPEAPEEPVAVTPAPEADAPEAAAAPEADAPEATPETPAPADPSAGDAG